MELNKEQELHFNKCFDFLLKYFVSDISEYKDRLIETIKDTEIKSEMDKLWLFELAEEMFVFKSKKLIGEIEVEINGKKAAVREANNLLNPDAN